MHMLMIHHCISTPVQLCVQRWFQISYLILTTSISGWHQTSSSWTRIKLNVYILVRVNNWPKTTAKLNPGLSSYQEVCQCDLSRCVCRQRVDDRIAAKTLEHAFINSRVDHCNSMFNRVSARHFNSLQFVTNEAPRLLTKITKLYPLLATIRGDLQWLPMK